MSRPPLKSSQNAVARAAIPRLFVLELNAGRIHSMNTDGSDRKTIVSDCHLPDGIVVDAEGGHIYWTTAGAPEWTVWSHGMLMANIDSRATIRRNLGK